MPYTIYINYTTPIMMINKINKNNTIFSIIENDHIIRKCDNTIIVEGCGKNEKR